MEHYFGAHYDSHNLIESAEKIKRAGGNLIQIFITLPNQPRNSKNSSNSIAPSFGKDEQLARQRSPTELSDFKNHLLNNNMKVVVHSSYMHNIARNWNEYSWWIKNLETEIKYASYIGALGIVLHFGKILDLTIEEAYNNMYTSLVYVHNKTKEYSDIKIFLETSSGQGTESCTKIEDLAHFYKKISRNSNKEFKDRIKLCIDTCHIFAAGYNLETKKDIKRYLEIFEELIGIRYIYLIHLNDSKVKLGAMKDRHDNIGKGYIGLKGLTEFYKYFKNLGVPIILETPNNGYVTEIKLLKNS
jgi:deoxyribonuclease-4